MTIDDPRVLAELRDAFESYERALLANDIETLDGLFRDAPETIRYGVGENLYGHDEIAAFRRARPGGAPLRRLTRIVITSFGGDFGVTAAEYVLSGTTEIGRQTQTWVRTAVGWRIVSAHVSKITK